MKKLCLLLAVILCGTLLFSCNSSNDDETSRQTETPGGESTTAASQTPVKTPTETPTETKETEAPEKTETPTPQTTPTVIKSTPDPTSQTPADDTLPLTRENLLGTWRSTPFDTWSFDLIFTEDGTCARVDYRLSDGKLMNVCTYRYAASGDSIVVSYLDLPAVRYNWSGAITVRDGGLWIHVVMDGNELGFQKISDDMTIPESPPTPTPTPTATPTTPTPVTPTPTVTPVTPTPITPTPTDPPVTPTPTETPVTLTPVMPTPTETPEEPGPLYIAGHAVSHTGKAINVYFDYVIAENGEGNYDVTVNAYLDHYSLFCGERTSENNITIGENVFPFSTPSYNVDISQGKQHTLLASAEFTYSPETLPETLTLSACWLFNGTYSGLPIGLIEAQATVDLSAAK